MFGHLYVAKYKSTRWSAVNWASKFRRPTCNLFSHLNLVPAHQTDVAQLNWRVDAGVLNHRIPHLPFNPLHALCYGPIVLRTRRLGM